MDFATAHPRGEDDPELWKAWFEMSQGKLSHTEEFKAFLLTVPHKLDEAFIKGRAEDFLNEFGHFVGPRTALKFLDESLDFRLQ